VGATHVVTYRYFHHNNGENLILDSAELQDHQVDILFIGGADVLHRQALGALSRHFRVHPKDGTGHLDNVSGTGQFLEILKGARWLMRVTGINFSYPTLWQRSGCPNLVPFASPASECRGLSGPANSFG
jgi:hypothetical protein